MVLPSFSRFLLSTCAHSPGGSTKLEQKHSLERSLCELKRQNGGMRVELQRASKQLSL